VHIKSRSVIVIAARHLRLFIRGARLDQSRSKGPIENVTHAELQDLAGGHGGRDRGVRRGEGGERGEDGAEMRRDRNRTKDRGRRRSGRRSGITRTRRSPRSSSDLNRRSCRIDCSIVVPRPRRRCRRGARYRGSGGRRNCFASSASIDDRAICKSNGLVT